MIRLFTAYFFLFVNFSSQSQYSFSNHENIHFTDFFESTLFYVETGIKDVDEAIEASLKKRWQLTPFLCVTEEEFKEQRTVKFCNLGFFTYRLEDMRSPNLAVFLPNYYGSLYGGDLKNVVAAVPIDCGETNSLGALGNECDFSKMTYRIDLMILQLIEVIEFVKENKYETRETAHFGIDDYIRSYNSVFSEKVEYKKILVNEEIFKLSFTQDDFKSLAKFQFQIVDGEEYRDLINKRNRDYFYLITAHNPMLVASVYDPEIERTLFLQMNYKFGPWLNSKKRASFGRKFVKNLNDNLSKIDFGP